MHNMGIQYTHVSLISMYELMFNLFLLLLTLHCCFPLPDNLPQREKEFSHTVLVAMSSWPPQPDLYCKIKGNTRSIMLNMEIMKKIQGYSITLELCKNFKSLGGWVAKPAMADATKTTTRLIGHVTYTQAPMACGKNTFHLFHFTQQV